MEQLCLQLQTSFFKMFQVFIAYLQIWVPQFIWHLISKESIVQGFIATEIVLCLAKGDFSTIRVILGKAENPISIVQELRKILGLFVIIRLRHK